MNMTPPNRTALIMIDFQVALCEHTEPDPLPSLVDAVNQRGIVGKAAVVLAAARRAGVFVLHTRVAFEQSYEGRSNRTPRWDRFPAERAMLANSAEAQIVTALAPLASEPVLLKSSVDPFIGTPLLNVLVGREIRKVAIAGVATNLAVESAARHGGDSGLDVTIIEDLCASFNPDAHEFSVGTILPLFARVISSKEYVAELDFAAGAPARPERR